MTRPYIFFVLPVLLIGILATFLGLQQISWFSASSHKIITGLLIGAVVVEALARLFNFGRLTTGAIAAFGIAVFANAIWPLLVSLLFAFSSFLLGHAVLAVLKINKNSLTGIAYFLVGAGTYGTAVGLLAHFPVNYAGLYWLGLLIPIIIERRSLRSHIGLLVDSCTQSDKYKWLDLAIALVALVYFSVALMPEVGHDALASHLFIPGHLAHRHEWSFDVTTYVWAVMPMMGDWIFSLVNMLGGETAARMTNVGFIFTLSWLLHELVLWAGGGARGARWAVLIFLTTPLTYTEASSLFIESIWASFVVAGMLSVLKIISTDNVQKVQLPVAGFLLGSALAAKAVTFTILPVPLLFLLLRYRYWFSKQLAPYILSGLVLFIMVGAIPYITAWLYTGNPIFPFFNEYFQAPQYPAENFSAPAIFEKGVSWDTIYRITFDSGSYLESMPGAAGFQWLLLLLPAMVLFTITWDRRKLALVIIGLLAVVLTFHHTAYLRYVLPSFVILSAAIGAFISVILSNRGALLQGIVLIVTVSSILLNLLFFKSGTYYGHISYKPLKSMEARAQYLRDRLPIRNAVSLVNQLNANRTPVAVFAPPLTAGLHSDALYPNWYNHMFYSLVNSADNEEALAGILLSKGVDYVIVDENWGSLEKREIIYKAAQEVSNIGSISVRILRNDYRFNTELLNDTVFSADYHWHLSKGAKMIADGVLVNVVSNAFQVVHVMPVRRYLLTIQAGCANEVTQGRLQVNWIDEDSNLINANIKVFDCAKTPSSHAMEVVAPQHAVNAVIYATGHTQESLIINKVSFKQ